MARRMFGRHEYARRRVMGWPVYSPKVKPRESGKYVSRHERDPLFGTRKRSGSVGWWWWR